MKVALKLTENQIPLNLKYDVCIVGGGAGGVAAAYALKNSGLSVCLVEQLDSLGGTHTNAGVIQFLASPAPVFLKNICEDLSKTPYFRWDIDAYSVGDGEESDFDRLWRGSFINYPSNPGVRWGNCFSMNPVYLQNKYFQDLSETIDIRFNRRMISHNTVDGVIDGIVVENLLDGKKEIIQADYFIDASGNGDLCRYGGELDKDYFVGADSKSLYNEDAIEDGFEGNHYELNSLEPTYLIRELTDNSIAFEPLVCEPVDGISDAVNNIWKYPGDTEVKNAVSDEAEMQNLISDAGILTNVKLVSPDWHAGLNAAELIDYGYDYLYNKGKKHAKAHFNVKFKDGKSQYLGMAKLLAIRESYRIKCDRMLTQADVEDLATSKNLVQNHFIALASWYCDIHKPVSVTKTAVKFRQLFGVPYESIIPSAYKNVLMACKAFGASHVAVSSCRLTKTVMSIGYSAGKAMEQAVKGRLTDVRNVDLRQLQKDCGVIELAKDLEKHFDLK